jgi:hypothetical protein
MWRCGTTALWGCQARQLPIGERALSLYNSLHLWVAVHVRVDPGVSWSSERYEYQDGGVGCYLSLPGLHTLEAAYAQRMIWWHGHHASAQAAHIVGVAAAQLVARNAVKACYTRLKCRYELIKPRQVGFASTPSAGSLLIVEQHDCRSLSA